MVPERGTDRDDERVLCLCTNTTTVTKTIGLSDDAYERLAALKGEGESFSDVVRRLTGGPLLRELAGTMDEATAEHYRAAIEQARRRQDEERRSRVEGMLDAEEDEEATR